MQKRKGVPGTFLVNTDSDAKAERRAWHLSVNTDSDAKAERRAWHLTWHLSDHRYGQAVARMTFPGGTAAYSGRPWAGILGRLTV